ncbi:putative potential Monad-binding region of RPAP3 [Trypoxylus dichotomus]
MESFLLQKQVRDNANDLQEFCKDLQEWGKEMNKKDESLKRSSNNQSEIPLPRNKVTKIMELDKQATEHKPTMKTKKIGSCDYSAWDKFDADAYCEKMDKEEAGEDSSPESELSGEIDDAAIDLANSEKEKGNAFVKKQQWDKAIECYKRAIESYAYDPIYYANRALCYLKKEEYKNAESDCTTALQLDKTYVKAYQRRAAARENLNQITEAHNDLLRVLELEPKNKESKTVLLQIEKKLEGIKKEKPVDIIDEPRPVSKFTLSRQKQKDSNIKIHETKADGTKNEVAFGEHVIERVLSSSSGYNKTGKIETEHKNDNKRTLEDASIKMKAKQNSDNKGRLEDTNTKMENKQSVKLDNLLLNRHDKDSIQLFRGIYKPPKFRSKKPLKRVEIIDVDLETEKLYLRDKLQDITENKDKESCEKEKKQNEINHEIVKGNEAPEPNCFEDLNLPIPKTSVQFYNSWKSISNKQFRKNYLRKINPSDFKLIFKESLETKMFSDILEVLNESCDDSTFDLHSYLVGLTEVKRFGALIMFMSSTDKKNLLGVIDHLKQDNRYSTSDIDNLIKMYEL